MPSIRSFFVFFAFFCFLGTTFALFSPENFVDQMQQQQSTLSSSEKKIYYAQLSNALRLLTIKNLKDTWQSLLYTSLQTYVDTQRKTLGFISSGDSSSSISSAFSGMIIPNVDLAKVRDFWVSLHNWERKIKNLTPFVYNVALEWTASNWANYLADLKKTTHKRKNTDGYYSYVSIKEWFNNQWIVFSTKEINGQSLFSESLGRWIYSCKKTDCTDDFIKAIKTSRMFFMSEKGKKYRPHYNAIVGNYTSIGLGVALIGNKYYLVSHYTQDLK